MDEHVLIILIRKVGRSTEERQPAFTECILFPPCYHFSFCYVFI